MTVHLAIETEEEKKLFRENLKVVCINHLTSKSGYVVLLTEQLAHELTASRRASNGVVSDLRVTTRALLKNIRRVTKDLEKINYMLNHLYDAVHCASVGSRFTMAKYTVKDEVLDDLLLETAELTGTFIK